MKDTSQSNVTGSSAIETGELLEKTLASLNEAILVVNPATREIVSCNRAAEEMFGYPREEIIGRNTEFLHVDRAHYEQFGRELFPALDANGVFHKEYLMRHRDGTAFPTEHTVTEILGEKGDRVGVVSAVRDITKRLAAERALKESEDRFRTLVETADDAIILMDTNFNRTYENEASWTGLGYTLEEWRKLGSWRERIHPDDIDLIKEKTGELFKTGSSASKYRIRHKDGHYVTRLAKSKVIHSDGKPVAVLAILRDITGMELAETALLESERKYRQLTEQASEGIFVVDQRGRYLDVNPAGLEMVGYSLEELRGMTIPDLMPPDELKKAPSRFPEILSGKTIISERTLKRKDGSLFQAEITAKLMSDGNVLATQRDITERKRSEKALVAAKEEAERSNKAKSVFLSSMSHEIRTPLTSVIGFSQLLATDTEHPLNDFQKNLLGKVVDSGNKLLELINSALDLARIESGVIEVSIEVVEMISLAATALTSSAQMAKEYGVRLGSKPASVDCYVMADSALLSQVVTGLLSNAIKYNKKGGETILAWKLSDENKVHISVSDEGPGISEDNIKNLYKPFDRLGMEGRNIQGFGVGLAIAKRLVELMGGEVGVESEVGEGSTFYIVLPAGKKP